MELAGASQYRSGACSRSVRRPPAERLHFIELDFVLIESKPGSQTWLAILAVLEKTGGNGNISSVNLLLLLTVIGFLGCLVLSPEFSLASYIC